MSSLRKYLLFFVNEHRDFRYPEIKSIIKLFNLDIKLPPCVTFGNLPYWIVEDVKESDIKKLASRALSLKYAFEVWANDKTIHGFHEKLKCFNYDPIFAKSSFKVHVESYNKHFSMKEKVLKIDSLDYLKFEGKIDLKNPQNEFVYFEFWGMDPMDVPSEPEQVAFGRWIADGQREIVKTISLKTRKFIGNTSMDPLLSLLMANQALCDDNKFVFDPFCGTGSLMIAAAKFGSYVVGSDIDYLMLHGRSKPTRVRSKVRDADECVKANFQQYGLQHLYLDVLVGDFSICPLNRNLQFDAIVTDPPYGIRESMEQIVHKSPRKSTAMTEDAIHYPSTSNYSIKSMYYDLLTYSSKHLRLGGRLVCWFPIVRTEFDDKILPQHSAMELVANSEQILSGETSRILLTYEKVAEQGEIVECPDLNEFDFRLKFFNHGDGNREERRTKTYQENLREAMKRGKNLINKTEMKKLKNKKMMYQRENQGE